MSAAAPVAIFRVAGGAYSSAVALASRVAARRGGMSVDPAWGIVGVWLTAIGRPRRRRAGLSAVVMIGTGLLVLMLMRGIMQRMLLRVMWRVLLLMMLRVLLLVRRWFVLYRLCADRLGQLV